MVTAASKIKVLPIQVNALADKRGFAGDGLLRSVEWEIAPRCLLELHGNRAVPLIGIIRTKA